MFTNTDLAKTEEVTQTLKCVMDSCSAPFKSQLSKTFSAKFPKFESAKNFDLAKTKLMYVMNHGIEPYFKTLLNSMLETSEIISYKFKKSLNETTRPLKWTCMLDVVGKLTHCPKLPP